MRIDNRMNSRRFILIAVALSIPLTVRAQFDFSAPAATEPLSDQTEPVPAEPPAEPSAEPSDEVAQLTTSDPDEGPYEGIRDPFWPVGFTPAGPKEDAEKQQAEKEKTVEEPKWEEATKLLDVKGVMNAGGGKYVAMINNQVVKEGDEVAVRMGSLEYRWKVRTISSRGARFEPLTADRPQ